MWCKGGPFKSGATQLSEATASLHHRGPDACNTWEQPEGGIQLGHTRLAIQDLSDSGSQPMHSNSARTIIVFNGEIYNHLELRKELPSVVWRGPSDTETLVELIEAFGVKKALLKCVGMFAFACWNCDTRTLYLARDRFGEKPLLFVRQNDLFAFASELKALRRSSLLNFEVNTQAIPEYLNLGYLSCKSSIWKGVEKVEPGCFIEVTNCSKSFSVKKMRYWSLHQSMGRTERDRSNAFADISPVDRTEQLIQQSVKSQLISEVPIGALLSGGVDSSLVTAVMQALSSENVKTFSVGFEEAGFDESAAAQAVAEFLGTDHKNYLVTASEALAVARMIATVYDEPFGDSSAIPTYLISKFASNDVSVVLTGDGADELFGGYNRYQRTIKLWNLIRNTPRHSKPLLGLALETTLIPTLETLSYILPKGKYKSNISANLFKTKALTSLIGARTIEELYVSYTSHWMIEEPPLINTPTNLGWFEPTKVNYHSCLKQITAMDIDRYLVGDILNKVDTASMANSLETRAPFLDVRLAEFGYHLSDKEKISGNESKLILKKVLRRYIPESLFDRPKMGFGIPLSGWIKGPLKEWSADLLHSTEIRDQGIFCQKSLLKLWNDHLNEVRDHSNQLWIILMFQVWLKETCSSN